MKILVLDQAKTCGWALFDSGELAEYGVEKLGDSKTTYENILLPAVKFAKGLIEKTKADMVVIENIQYQSNLATYRKLALLQGALICLFDGNESPYFIVEPSKWRAFCKIKGKKRQEQKESAIEFVLDKFEVEATTDEADAICMGWWGVNNIKIDGGMYSA